MTERDEPQADASMIPLQRDYWNQLSDDYQRITRITVEDFHYGPQIPGESTLRLLPEIGPGTRALELGCGAAQNSRWLAKKGVSCTAMDISEEQIRHAQDGARKEGVSIRFCVCPMETFSTQVDGVYDLIHSSHAFEFVDSPEVLLKEIFDALVPGGTFVMSTVHPLYNGEWVGATDEETETHFAVENEEGEEERGLFLTNYFSPPDDVRYDEDGNPVVISRAYPISKWFQWFRDAGFEVQQILEPSAVPRTETPPYTSDAWAEPDGELEAIPGTLIFVAKKRV